MSDIVQWENPPSGDVDAPRKERIIEALVSRPGKWAVVYRADRIARAERVAYLINAGAEYGEGFEAVARKVGAECRVYARKV